MYTFTTNLYQMFACFGPDIFVVILHCISVAEVFDLKTIRSVVDYSGLANAVSSQTFACCC